jgi:uncharacterized membrane protein YebE (DUF533 family)
MTEGLVPMTPSISRIVLAAMAVLSVSAVTASADEIDRRQSSQERRIQQGVRSGELTRGEYYRLETEQARIRALEARAKADGRVDRYEAAQIRQAQDNASRHIYQEKHDGDRRWTRRWW